MERHEAAAVLGIAPDASSEETRTAFRRLIRERHPDRAGAGATVESTRLIEAYRTLRRPAPEARPADGRPATEAQSADGGPPPGAGPVDGRVDGDSITLDLDPSAVMARLIDAGHRLGEITYLDRSSGYLEVLLGVLDEGDVVPAAVSLVASLQGRVDGVEIFCTVERLDGHPAPPVAPLVDALAAEMGLHPS